jgi:hypothetical protein
MAKKQQMASKVYLMRTMNKKFTFDSNIVLWSGGQGAWHFAHVPKDMSQELKTKSGHLMRGWSSFPVQAKIGRTSWDTSIFYDKKSAMFILPLKALVRKKENIFSGDTVSICLRIKL